MIRNRLKKMIPVGEPILWEGRPSKRGIVLESIFNKMLPIAIVWTLFDGFFLFGAFSSGQKEFMFFSVPFLMLHMTPVWIYLGVALTGCKRYANTAYIITDRGIYTSTGFNYHQQAFPLKDISNLEFNQGLFDSKLHIGDVTVCGKQFKVANIDNIKEYEFVYQLLCRLREDMLLKK